MVDAKIAKNYATSLFENIKSDKDHQKVLDQIFMFNEILTNSNQALFVFNSPIISNLDKLKAIKVFGQKLKFERILVQFFEVLIKNSRFIILPEIIKEYKNLITIKKGIKSVIVEFANKPSKNQISLINKHLESSLQKTIELKIIENKSIIGGVIIKYDSLLYDYSLAGALSKIMQLSSVSNI